MSIFKLNISAILSAIFTLTSCRKVGMSKINKIMKTLNLKTSSFISFVTLILLLFSGICTNAQTPNDDALTIFGFNLLENGTITMYYKAEGEGTFACSRRSNFVKFYINEEVIFDGGNDAIACSPTKEYQHTINLSDYTGEKLTVKVEEYSNTNGDGKKGDLKYSTTKPVLDGIAIPAILKDNTFKFAGLIYGAKKNQCGGDSIKSYPGTPSEATIKAQAFQEEVITVVEYGKEAGGILYFSAIHIGHEIDKVVLTTRGGSSLDGSVNNLEIKSFPSLPWLNKYVEFNIPTDKLSFKKAYNHTYPIVLQCYSRGLVINTVVLTVLVVGEEIDLSAGKFTELSPPVPTMILHNPIGDGSSAFMVENASTCSQIVTGLENSTGANAHLKITAGVEGTIAGSVPFKATASAGFTTNSSSNNSKNVTSEVCFTEIKEIRTENLPDASNSLTGTAGDFFIGTVTEYYYGPSISVGLNGCKIDTLKGIGLKIKETKAFKYTEADIETNVIPNLEKLIANTNDTKTILRYQNQIAAWNNMINANQEYVNGNNVGEEVTVDAQHPAIGGQATSRNDVFTIETKVVMDNEVFAEAEVSVAGSGFSGRGGVTFSNTVSRSNTESKDYSKTVSYELRENDAGDIVKVKIIPDKRFGSHIFKLVEEGSQTSCPYIGGKKRDVPFLSIDNENVQTKVIKDISIGDGTGDKAFITLNVCNQNESGEARNYYIKAKDTKNAIIKYSGDPITNRGTLISDIPAGGCKQIDITIDQHNPDSLAYEGISLLLTDACSDVAGEEGIASEVTLDVYFEGFIKLSDYEVTFQVDLSNEVVSPEGVFVAGNFQQKAGFPDDWDPTTTPMTDTNEDGIYEATVNINQVAASNTFRYKFINGTHWESVPIACGIEEGGFINRPFELVENNNTVTLPVVCFANCVACEAIPQTLAVTPEDIQVIDAQGGNIQYTVFSDTDWTVTTNADWLGVNAPNNGMNDGMVLITCNQNESSDARAAEIRFTSSNGIYHARVVSQVGFSLNCTITSAGLQVSECMDNGTPNDTSDDYYEYSLAPEGENLAFNYSVYANNVRLGSEFIYGQREVIAQVPINTNVGTIAIFNEDEIFNCQFNIEVNAPVCTIEPPVTNQADYKVKSMYTPPAEVMAGQEIYMNAEIVNNGTAGFTEKTKAYYWLSVDNQLDTTEDIYLEEDNINPLAIDAINFDEEYLFIPKDITPGLYYLIYQADALNQVTEKDENNNTASKQITVIGNQPMATTLTCDDFEQYQTGSICSQSPVWTKWSSNSAGGAITSDQAAKGTQSLEIAHHPQNANQTDILARMGDLNTGNYQLSWKMYVVEGKAAHFNSQKFQDQPGQEFGFEIFFDTTGQAKLKTGGFVGNFDYPQAEWMEVVLDFNLDEDEVILTLNGTAVFKWDISYTIRTFGKTTQLGAINFFAIENALFYIDEICLAAIPENQLHVAESRNGVPTLSIKSSTDGQKQINKNQFVDSDAQLLQNYPNPVTYQTTIPVSIPFEFQSAQLKITSIDGRTIKVLNIKNSGAHQLHVSTNDWSEGIYFYALLINDKLISTKRMIVTK